MHAGSLDELLTRRLRGERVGPQHLDGLLRLHAEPRVAATLGGVASRETVAEQLARAEAHWREHGFGCWVFHEDDPPLPPPDDHRALVGRAFLHHYRAPWGDEIELGYALMPPFWGGGFATEIAATLADTAFEALGIETLVAFTLPGNHASRRVMERVGFRYERDFAHRGMQHALCRLQRRDWPRARARLSR